MIPRLRASLTGRRLAPAAEGAATTGWVQAYDAALLDEAGQAAAVVEAGGFWAGQSPADSTRLLAWARPYEASAILDCVAAARAACDPRREPWRYASLTEQLGAQRRLLAAADLRAIDYYLLCWPASGSGRRMLQSAAGFFGTPVTATGLPPLFGNYQDQGAYLEPLDGPGLYLALYSVYQLSGHWTPTTIHRVLQVPFPLALAIDIENRGGKGKGELDRAYNTLSGQLKSQLGIGSSDAHAAAALADVMRAQAALENNQTLHQARIVLLLGAPTLELLTEYGARLAADLHPILQIRREPGQQGELLKYFAPIPRRQIRATVEPLPLLSAGCGVLAGQFGYAAGHASRGLLLGFDTRASNPIVYDLWGRAETRGPHAAFLGGTGSGKTFMLEVLLYRAATILDTQVFVLDVMTNFVGLPGALGAGCRYCRVGLNASLNLLDLVYPASPPQQIQHVIAQLGLLLGAAEAVAAGGDGPPRRRFDHAERNALDGVLRALYAPLWGDPVAIMPLLGNLSARLEDLDLAEWPGARALGRTLRETFVESSLGPAFNRQSTIPRTFPAQVYIFDLAEDCKAYGAVVNMQLMTILRRWITDPGRTKPLILAIDEFKILAADRLVAQAAVDLTKIGRNYRLGVWTADQNISSYFITPQAQQILANLALVMIGRLQAKDIDDVMGTYQQLTAAHRRRMGRQQTGQFVTIAADDYHFVNFEPTGRELGYFGGDRDTRRKAFLATQPGAPALPAAPGKVPSRGLPLVGAAARLGAAS